MNMDDNASTKVTPVPKDGLNYAKKSSPEEFIEPNPTLKKMDPQILLCGCNILDL